MARSEEELIAEFEALGEDELRKRLAAGIYGEKKARSARAWLERKALARSDLANAKQVEIASSSRDAAWASARSAAGANTRATIALVISGIALLAAVAGLVLGAFPP